MTAMNIGTAFSKIFLLCAALLLGAASSFAASAVTYLSYASTNVTSSAYVTLLASSPSSSSHIEICDSSTQIIKVAKGAAGSEVDIGTGAGSGCVILAAYTPPGTRISLEAVSTSATTGSVTVSLLP